ncbi:hypothetical protein [Arabidopsis thaliana]|uniref:Uncharacterized protein T10K17.290 n=3 Tax=Arabidopsis TaxID=3701 RepID=Q9M2P0_ARATH|nr:hypothetical protein ISN45_At03g051100 [Arabidopsis thaliana x Arabidopsis arenosa]KAG7634847.1 hypothetical protein ISN44_As03g049920 [Arabidopsis suecica]CAB67636.1 hypothetical protein [Arabidopsis thaliana]
MDERRAVVLVDELHLRKGGYEAEKVRVFAVRVSETLWAFKALWGSTPFTGTTFV